MRKYLTEDLLTQCAAVAGPNSTFENFLKAGEEKIGRESCRERV